MALSDSYCSASDLRDVYPQINDFDAKRPIFGWQLGLRDYALPDNDLPTSATLDLYYAPNSGNVNQLFVNGIKIPKITYNTTETTKVDGAFTSSATVFSVDAGHGLAANDIVKIDSEYIRIVSVSSDTITITSPSANRGLMETSAKAHANDTSVYRIIDVSSDLTSPDSSTGSAYTHVYDPDLDICILIGDDLTTSANLPINNNVESGEDWKTHLVDIIKKASRYFDSRVDATISRDQFKDKNGEYDYLVVRTTALIACSFLISAHSPTSDLVEQIKEELNFNIDLINTGKAKLSHQITGDSSQGIVREVVSPQNSNPLYLVDTRGSYTGSSYDLIKVVITTAGAIGTGKFDVYMKDSNGLKNNQVVTAEKITGDYQSIGNGLYVRFQGKDSSSEATVGGTPDEWEIEVWGKGEELADAGINAVRSVGMTRGGYGVWQ